MTSATKINIEKENNYNKSFSVKIDITDLSDLETQNLIEGLESSAISNGNCKWLSNILKIIERKKE